MPLNKSTGNMYPFITHTWNPIKGVCFHDCAYCYMKAINRRFNKTPAPIHLDEKELKTDLGSGNFIFAGSSCDMFAEDIPHECIFPVLGKCHLNRDNAYLFQTKNPRGVLGYEFRMLNNCTVCITLETNRPVYPIMGKSPMPEQRAHYFAKLDPFISRMITIEPIMDFDLDKFITMLYNCFPKQVNIGADSGNNRLPEPPKEKVLELIAELEKFTKVYQKKNLERLAA